MNLVKAQEYAQALPLAELKKYADGFDPAMIPPWLATGEMQAKMKRAEMANNLQGAANGPMPSVKDQVEQKVGLFALQQAQQQAQQQQMMQPRPAGGPVPDGTPQPRPQPRPAGLDQLPSNIEMAGGGIVAFANGSKVEGNDDDEDLPPWASAQRKAKRKAAEARLAADAERERNMAIARAQGENMRPTMANDPRMLRAPAGETVGATPAPAPAQAPAGLAAVAQKPQLPRPVAPAAPAPAPAAPAPAGYDAMLRDALQGGPKERTAAEAVAEQQALNKAAGLTEPAGKAQLDRIAAMQQQYEGSKPSGLDDLIRVFSQAGQFKGLTGTGPAYTAMQAQKRAQDLSMAEKINEMMGGVETTQRGEMKDVATRAGTDVTKSREQASQFGREKMQSLANVRGQDVQAGSSKYNADMHYKAAMAQLSNANLRQDMQEKRLLLDAFKTELATIDRELGPLLKAPFGPAKDQIAALQARKAGLTKALDEASGISKITGAPSATSPSGTSTSGWGKAQVVK
jgi:hypothetical protein